MVEDNVVTFVGDSHLLLDGLAVTILISILSIVFGFLLGMVLALAMFNTVPIMSSIAHIYTVGIRATPLITLAYVLFYGLPEFGIRVSTLSVGVFVMAIFSSSYFAEILRAGLNSVPRSQLDAGSALGFSNFQTFRIIVFPQTIRFIRSPCINLSMSIAKDTAVLSTIGVEELTYRGIEIQSTTSAVMETLTFITIAYWCVNMSMSAALTYVEGSVSSRSKPPEFRVRGIDR